MTTKTMTRPQAKRVCMRAVSLVTRALAGTDWTAPVAWETALKAEAASDRRYYRSGTTVAARTAPEREALLVETMLGASDYTIDRLYGLRDAHRDAIIIGVRHRDLLQGLGIDREELGVAVEVLGEARRS